MTTVPAQNTSDATLPADLKVELWKRVDRRLQSGEVLITNEQFFKATVRDFRRLAGVVPTASEDPDSRDDSARQRETPGDLPERRHQERRQCVIQVHRGRRHRGA